MIYIKGLYDTYNKLEEQGLIGQYDEDGLGIYPKYHHIKGIDKNGSAYQVVINSENGAFTINKIVPNDDNGKKYLVYPTTIYSASRGKKKGAPHGVCEELKYIGTDFNGETDNYKLYLEQLKDWVLYSENDVWLTTVFRFLTHYDVGKLLVEQYPEDKIERGTFVTFAVNINGEIEDIGTSKRLQDCWIRYQENKFAQDKDSYLRGQDSLTGKEGVIPDKHRMFFGTSKLLSKSNNMDYHKGRFIEDSGIHDIFSITHETSQKAYNLLGYLVSTKGKNIVWLGSETRLIMWMDGEEIEPDIAIDEELDEFTFDDEEVNITDTMIQEYLTNTWGQMTSTVLNGGHYNIHILLLVKTNNGRTAIKKYQKLTDLGYQDVLNYWYATTSWGNLYNDNRHTTLSLRGLVNNLFGHEVEEKGKYYNIKVNKGFEGKAVSLIEELIESKMNKQRLPTKFYKKAMGNVKQRHRYPNTWEKTLMTTLSMYKKYQWDYKNKYVGVDVEVDNQSNSYLYGRLMAVYEQIEGTAMYYKGVEKRQTFVEKNWSSIVNRPLHMWDRMNVKTQPYMNQLMSMKPAVGQKYKNLLLEIGSQLSENGDFATKGKKPLEDDFILGYYHQLKALRIKKTNTQGEEINE